LVPAWSLPLLEVLRRVRTFQRVHLHKQPIFIIQLILIHQRICEGPIVGRWVLKENIRDHSAHVFPNPVEVIVVEREVHIHDNEVEVIDVEQKIGHNLVVHSSVCEPLDAIFEADGIIDHGPAVLEGHWRSIHC